MKIKSSIKRLTKDYELRSFISSSFSFFAASFFLIYNFIIGILYRSVWNFSISFYYLLLGLLRGLIIFSEKKWQNESENIKKEKRIKLFRKVSFSLILLDIALVVPISLMVLSQRAVTMGMIPAIAIAAYTTYKVTMSVINYNKTRKQNNLSLFGLKIINLKDATVSVLTLQNTLVMVFGDSKSMLKVTAFTSAIILLFMIILTILLIRRAKNKR